MFLYFFNQKFAKKIIRKDRLSPGKITQGNTGASSFASLFKKCSCRGSLTVEAALVFPIFLFVMISVMRYITVMETAVKFGASLSECSKEIAAASYLNTREEMSGNGIIQVAAGLITYGGTTTKINSDAGDLSAVKNTALVKLSGGEKKDRVDLIWTYQMRSAVKGLLPEKIFLQRASVRAWTGRLKEGKTSEEDGEDSADACVYVTATGTVYHEDPDCTYLKPSVRETDKASVEGLRNNSGGKYYCCERCGEGSGSTVYITNDGNRYHSSPACSALKRTVEQVSREDCTLKGCSKCSKSGD